DEQVAAELGSMMRDREVHGRPIEVRLVQNGEELAELHVLFIARERAPALVQLRDIARENAVLVVTEWDGALEAGSAINFRLVDHRIRFEVSLDAADASGLSISSRMLVVAERVEPRSAQ
ncbi:MAG TPA: YfiR family protein, partial [Woeseiaceae bacterium]|nr:YfiR family protein [Woeseiaceae bacterium]